MEIGIQHIKIQKQKNSLISQMDDVVAVEAPLEIQIQHHREGQPRSISVTMRTPGNDKELSLGFLYTEGLIQDISQVKSAFSFGENTILVQFAEGFTIDLGKTERNFYTTSSCGVCGKSSIDAIKTKSPFIIEGSSSVSASVLFSLKQKLAGEQSLFSLTGGIHAAALFDLKGNIEQIYEDVGRHNALDKLVGDALINQKLPLRNRILFLSGRASFELIQKAVMAGIETIVAVGAPSSLAIELAKENNQTLIGFLKEESFNVYTDHSG